MPRSKRRPGVHETVGGATAPGFAAGSSASAAVRAAASAKKITLHVS